MDFEKTVKQQKFRSNQAKTAMNIIFTANSLEEISRNYLNPHDISSEQYNVLRILRGNHPESYAIQEIRDCMLNRWSNVSRLVDKLKKKGYLTRQQMKSNRRKVEINITEKGLEFLEELEDLPIAGNLYDEGLTSDKAEKLSSLLDELRTNLKEFLEDEK